MTQDSLMMRMLAAGVDPFNPQAVFDFYHAQHSEKELDLQALQYFVQNWVALAIVDKADYQALESKVNRDELQAYALREALADKAEQSAIIALDRDKADKNSVNQQLDTKLDRSEFHQHFRGLFATADDLASQVIDPVAGDHAHVDAGPGEPTEIHAYDVNDGIWRKQGSNELSVTSTDSIPEGNTNLYFQAERVKSVVRGMNSGDIPEGKQQYFTEARVLAVINPLLAPIHNQIGEIDSLLTQILGG